MNGRVTVEAALLVPRRISVVPIPMARYTVHPAFAVTVGAEDRAAPLAAVALLDRRGVRHGLALDLGGERLAGSHVQLPGEGRRAVVGAVHLVAEVRAEGPRRLAPLGERLQGVLQSGGVVQGGDGHVAGGRRAVAAAPLHVGDEGGAGLLLGQRVSPARHPRGLLGAAHGAGHGAAAVTNSTVPGTRRPGGVLLPGGGGRGVLGRGHADRVERHALVARHLVHEVEGRSRGDSIVVVELHGMGVVMMVLMMLLDMVMLASPSW